MNLTEKNLREKKFHNELYSSGLAKPFIEYMKSETISTLGWTHKPLNSSLEIAERLKRKEDEHAAAVKEKEQIAAKAKQAEEDAKKLKEENDAKEKKVQELENN